MNERIKELAQQYACHTETMTGVETEYILDADDLQDLIDAVRQDEREAIEKIVKRLRPEIVGAPNDPDSHQQWCDSAAAFSRFESVIAAIRARSKHD